MRGLKLGREQTKFNLAFENLTLVFVSNRPDYGKAVIVVPGMVFKSQPQSVCNFCKDFGPDSFKIFVSHVHFLEIIFEISAETWPWLNSQANKTNKNGLPQANNFQKVKTVTFQIQDNTLPL